MAVWYDFYQTSGGAISRTSEWVISHQHEFDKMISHCHPCDYLFIIYHTTRNNRNFVYTYHSNIYYTSTHCHFLTLQITVCLSCQTQQAMHNALCDVAKQSKKYITKIKTKYWRKKIQFQKKQNFTNKISKVFPHKICIVSYSSYHTPTLLPVEYDEYWCDKHNTGIW